MVYFMEYYVDGGCRHNGTSYAIGAAAAVRKNRWGKTKGWVRYLHQDAYDPPTNQKAEITAIILALELALQRFQELYEGPLIDVEIFSDSRYAIGCMTIWCHKWTQNGWTNAAGNPVANQDLIKEALKLDNELAHLGTVQYTWIDRSQNEDADGYCNRAMDQIE
jgi:ribonuclease HI